MANNELNIIVKAQELAVHSFKLTSNCDKFPKKYRHSLVDKIQNISMDLYITLKDANSINNKTHKILRCETISKAINYCDILLFCIELSMSLNLISSGSVAYWSKMVTDVKHMAIAWRKKELSQ